MRKNKRSPLGCILLIAVILIGFVAFFAAKWYIDVYGQTGFDSVLFTLFSGLSDVQSDLIGNYLLHSLLPALICTTVISFILLYRPKVRISLKLFQKIKLRLYPLRRPTAAAMSLVLCGCCIWNAARQVQLPQYFRDIRQQTELYEEAYVAPETVDISFPEEKRNLIYILLESMECTFFSEEEGGALQQNVIPELYALAEENVNFSQTQGVGGSCVITGTSWTMAAMTAQTSGLPLRVPVGADTNGFGESTTILSGVTTLNDLLHQEGYAQALMVGSNSEFGGRKRYFENHGVETIYDVYTAKEEGLIDEDYWVWWGMEDLYLYEYAKEKITRMAEGDQPFAFTMLTVDTHHIGGYVCQLCGEDHAEQYENVYSCASRQLAEFIAWLQEQDFYENTTIVITGDHPSMDWDYMQRNVDTSNYTRRVYNCFMNSAVQTEYAKNREFLSFDLFPTILASIGCEIEGERLGLGVNLFSGNPTLVEQYGYAYLDSEISKNSFYYNHHFMKLDSSEKN